MNKYKVCVYAICKNEEKFADRWMDSMSEADMVVVTDTGSDDETVDKLRARGAIVYIDEVKPWRFDAARNISLEHVPEDIDICVCTDLDEMFEKGWRERLEAAWTPDTKRGKYIYNWSLKADGSPDVQIYYTKVHARKDFKWSFPVHEWLTYLSAEPQKTVFIEGMVLNHYPDPCKSRGSYLQLLELAWEEEPSSDRIAYYLGREYMYKGEWNKCIETLKKHLALPSATWNEERCASMRWIANSYWRLNNLQEAYNWYFRAIAEAPYLRDPYVECARVAYYVKDWTMVFFMVEEALKIKDKSTTYVNMGYSWDHTPYDLGAIACYWLGMYERSISHAKAALEFYPEDERLRSNLRMIEEKAAGNKST
jgi:glycosyltransferase involved in cell wall biosynthesis